MRSELHALTRHRSSLPEETMVAEREKCKLAPVDNVKFALSDRRLQSISLALNESSAMRQIKCRITNS
jgi:hypothetical protein